MNTTTQTNVFSSYEEILQATKGHQVTAQELINQRTYITGEGWQNIDLAPKFRQKLAEDIAACLGGRENTRNSIANTIRHGRPQHWGLGRIFIEQHNGNAPRLSYCAGQDHPSEIKTIRNAIK